VIMPTLHIRDITDDVYQGLEALALRHGRSIEAEAREILTSAVKPVRMGQALWELGRELGLTDDEAEAIGGRHRAPSEPVGFDQ
jgi:plasmid stability protein